MNGEYRGDSDIGKLMHDFNCADADEMHFKILADKTRYLKKNEKGVTEMCRIMDEMKDEFYAVGREDGIAEGKEQGKKQGRRQGRLEQARSTALKLKLKGDSVEEIADLVGYSVSTVSKWLAPSAT